MSVDLSKCRKGDRLLMRNGIKATFIEKSKCDEWMPYCVEHDDGGVWRYTSSGSFISNGKDPCDIIRVLPRRKPRPKRSLGQVARRAFQLTCNWQAVGKAVAREVRRRDKK